MLWRLFKWLLSFCVLALVIVPAILLYAAVSEQPLVHKGQDYQLTQANVRRIKQVLKSADPRRLRLGASQTVSITEADVNVLLNYGMEQFMPGAAQVDLRPGAASIALAVSLAPWLEGRYFNTRFDLIQEDQHYTVSNWRFGWLQLPDAFSGWLVRLAHRQLNGYEPYRVALLSTEELLLLNHQVQVTYYWHQSLKEQLRITGRELLFDSADQARIAFYHEQIYQASRKLPRYVSLTELMRPLFAQAATRSATAEQAVAENRALLLALTFYLLRQDVSSVLQVRSRKLNYFWLRWPSLGGRRDLAQHFIVSAGITASAGSRIAGAAGLFKELKDSQGGSGFSFADLAADQAGTRFAEMALNSSQAQGLQQAMANAEQEYLFMPDVGQLPEGLQEATFTQQYANLDNPAYRAVVEEIARRISGCGLYQLAGSSRAGAGSR